MQTANTKLLISQSFLELLKKRSIDKITVRDIVEGCNITRQTFYYHFKDVFDLIEWIIKIDCEKVLIISIQESNPRKVAEVFIEFVKKHGEMLDKLMQSKERAIIENIIINSVNRYITELIKKKAIPNITQKDLDMAVDFYSFGIIGVMKGIHEKENIDINEMADRFIRLLTGDMFKV